MSSSKLLVVTPGDPEGIGPEVVQKTLRHFIIPSGFQVLIIGASEPWKKSGFGLVPFSSYQPNQKLTSGQVYFIEPPHKPTKHVMGYVSGWSIQKAVELILKKHAHALVTGPISKERINAAGFKFNGHTEMLAQLSKTKLVTMMMANPLIKVGLATTHVSIKDLPRALTQKKIETALGHTIDSLHTRFGIKKPRVAVMALNPHAGENGLFGNEESKIIIPAMKSQLKKWGSQAIISGPHPADTLMANWGVSPRYDAVIAMYHDQGLIPAKLLDFPRSVNVTLGLPFVRTSVDHGTAFDIAGKNKADPTSFESALNMAILMLSKRSSK